ncbi:MAG: filamentous hemagglutinin N-terminal domain-containing protein, partial [Planctomycetes bacterium]|nr:filamentous hemagglutinin N-terminal domain-containing protein [Planctomycetota bacterium]
MEQVRKVVKRYYLRQIMAYWLACWMFFGLPAQVMADINPGQYTTPTGFSTPGGIGDPVLSGANNEIMNLTQTANEAIINWNNFDIGADASVTFAQPGVTSAVLNRVGDGHQTGIMGALTANGRVFIINTAGILFGGGSSVSVAQLVASARGMSDADFLAGNMVFQHGDGIVENYGTINATDSAYLIGGDVFQHGTISVPNGDVVLVATENDKVTITYPNSDVLVEFSTPDPVATPSNGNGHPIGSGDIWSAALTEARDITAKAARDIQIYEDLQISPAAQMYATAVAASDAIAEIDLIAGADVTLSGADVSALAIASGTDNAIATTTVDAGGNVNVEAGNSILKAAAETVDQSTTGAGNLTATVNIDAGKELRVDDEGLVLALATTGDGASGAYGNLTATVNVLDAGVVNVLEGNIAAVAKTGQGSNLNAGEIKATVEIDAVGYDQTNGHISVGSHEIWDPDLSVWLSPIEAHAEAGSGETGTAGNITAIVDLAADGTLNVVDGSAIQAEARVGYTSSPSQAGNLTADVDIVTTNGDVDVENSDIQAIAGPTTDESPAVIGDTLATVDITSGANVKLVVEEGDENGITAEAFGGVNNTADIMIDAAREVKVSADTFAGAYIDASAYDNDLSNTAEVTVTAGTGVLVEADEYSLAAIAAEAENGTDNTANVEVTANDGNVEVKANNYSEALITAEAANAENSNNATVKVTAKIAVDSEADGDVYVNADNDSEASIGAYASNDFEDQEDDQGNIPGKTNDAKVAVTAAGDVEVTALNYSEAVILAKAYNEIDIYEDEGNVVATITGSLINDAGVTIVAGTAEPDPVDGGVQVYSGGADASIGAEAYNEIKVNGKTQYGIDLTVNGSMLNAADVDISATDQVQVSSEGYDSESWIYAEAYNEIENDSDQTMNLTVTGNITPFELVRNEAVVTIDAGDNTDLEYGNMADGDDVFVGAGDGGEAYIAAEAWNYLWDGHYIDQSDTLNVTVIGSVGNIAMVDITTGDEVWVRADGYQYNSDDHHTEYSEAGIGTFAGNEIEARWEDDGDLYEGTVNLTVTASLTNDADVVINAGDNVEVQAFNASRRGSTEAYIAAAAENEIYSGTVTAVVENNVDNNAKVDITTGDDVDVEASDYGEAYIEAWAGNYLEDQSVNTLDLTVRGSVLNTADVAIDAIEDVQLKGEYKGEVWIGASAINETDGEGVSVSADGSLDNKATVDILAGGNVEVEADSSKYSTAIIAEAANGNNNSADVKINATGDVGVFAKDGDAKIKALAYNDNDDVDGVLNHADIQITGANVNIISEDNGIGGDEVVILAYAHDADENRADILITAKGTEETVEDEVVIVGGDVTIQSAEGDQSDDAIVKAEAKNGKVNTATVGISAAANVDIKAYGHILDDDAALVSAEAWNDIDIEIEPEAVFVIEQRLVTPAEIDEETGEEITPAVYEDVEVAQEVIVDESVEGLKNTALVAIIADENVNIEGTHSGDAAVEALAHNDIEVDIDNYETEVTVNLTLADLENKAQVTISAEGEEGVSVNADGTASKAGIAAEAYNELELDQHTGGKYWVWDGFLRGHWEYLDAYA